VSRALNYPETVSEITRERILALVARHRYVLDGVASSFSSRRSGLIGLIVPTIGNSIYAAFTVAVQARLQAEGRKLLIANSNYEMGLERDVIRKLIESRVEGVILTGYKRETDLYDLLRHYRIPFVITWSTSPDPSVPAVSFDNETAAESAVEAIIEMGHRRIGLVCGKTSINDRAAQRLNAYRRTLERHGITFDGRLVQEREFEVHEGGLAVEVLMSLKPRPTAIFCANDIQALGALFACYRLGFVIPQDLSIVGFDDLPMSRFVNPSLTTIHVPAEEMGKEAANRIIRNVETEQPIEPLLLQTHIIRRDSLGPVPQTSRI